MDCEYIFCYKCGFDITNSEQHENKGNLYCDKCYHKPIKRNKRYKDGLDNGYVYLEINGIRKRRYRIVVELLLDRPLEPHETIHHINGNKLDDRPENLYICSWKEHIQIHNTKKQVMSNVSRITP